MRSDATAEWATIQTSVEAVLAEWQRLGGRLSDAERQRLTQAIKDHDQAALREALAGQVLLAVWINPEARVKVARGKAIAELVVEKPGVFLVEVLNDAGVKAELRAKTQGEEKGKETLFSADLVRSRAVSDRLGGQAVQYLLVTVRCHEVGRREATFVLDAGQGTQDLGFRSEVPVLFRVVPEGPRP